MSNRKDLVMPDPSDIKPDIFEEEKNTQHKDDSKEHLLSTIDDNLDKNSANNKKAKTDMYNKNKYRM